MPLHVSSRSFDHQWPVVWPQQHRVRCEMRFRVETHILSLFLSSLDERCTACSFLSCRRRRERDELLLKHADTAWGQSEELLCALCMLKVFACWRCVSPYTIVWEKSFGYKWRGLMANVKNALSTYFFYPSSRNCTLCLILPEVPQHLDCHKQITFGVVSVNRVPYVDYKIFWIRSSLLQYIKNLQSMKKVWVVLKTNNNCKPS